MMAGRLRFWIETSQATAFRMAESSAGTPAAFRAHSVDQVP